MPVTSASLERGADIDLRQRCSRGAASRPRRRSSTGAGPRTAPLALVPLVPEHDDPARAHDGDHVGDDPQWIGAVVERVARVRDVEPLWPEVLQEAPHLQRGSSEPADRARHHEAGGRTRRRVDRPGRSSASFPGSGTRDSSVAPPPRRGSRRPRLGSVELRADQGSLISVSGASRDSRSLVHCSVPGAPTSQPAQKSTSSLLRLRHHSRRPRPKCISARRGTVRQLVGRISHATRSTPARGRDAPSTREPCLPARAFAVDPEESNVARSAL